jgi:type VI secretion system secreted protein VgrG
MAQQVKATIELESGKKLTKYQSLVIEQYLFLHHKFEIIVPFDMLEKEDESFFNQSHKDVCGKFLTISFEPVLTKGTFNYSFKGIITELFLSNKGDMANVFVIRGHCPGIILEDCKLRRTFISKSVQQIFDSVMSPYPGNVIKKQLNPRSTKTILYSVQYDETNFEFLSRMASEYNEWFYYDGKEFLLGEPSAAKEVDFVIDGKQTFDMSITLMPTKFSLSVYDYTKNQSYTGKSTSQQVDGQSQYGKFALDESESTFSQEAMLVSEKPVYSQNELDEIIKFKRSGLASNLIVFHGRGENPDISISTVINVSGSKPQKGGRSATESFGKYRITEINHMVDGSGNYSSTFKAVPETVKIPPTNPFVRHPVGQMELAKVSDNNDPDKLGRVKVIFNWAGSDNESNWVRVGTFYAGGGDVKGMQFIPEKDAQVMISYESNRPENPFVITSLYPKKDGIRALVGTNDQKMIYTKAGNTIELTDKKGENTIQITNSNNPDTSILLEFKDPGQITIKTNGKINIQAQDNITISTQKDLSISAQNVDIEAQQNLTLKGSSQTNVEGSQISVKADSQLSVDGGGQATVKASGPLTLKGAMVQIN